MDHFMWKKDTKQYLVLLLGVGGRSLFDLHVVSSVLATLELQSVELFVRNARAEHNELFSFAL